MSFRKVLSSSILLCGLLSQLFAGTIKLDSLVYEQNTHQIVVFWTVDTAEVKEEGLTVGVEYSLDGPVVEPGEDTPIKPVEQLRDSTMLPYREGFLFDTTYYVSLHLKGTGGQWSQPTDSSQDTLSTPPFDFQQVTYFEDGVDEISAFNNKVLLKRDSSVATGVNPDTVKFYEHDNNVLRGFVSVGPAFTLGVQTAEFYLGIRYDSIPAGLTENDLRLYRITEDGRVKVVHESFTRDGVVWMRTVPNDWKLPYMVLADTLKPEVTILSGDVDQAVDLQHEQIIERFSISDNVSNVRYQVRVGEGSKNKIFDGEDSTVTLTDTFTIVTKGITLQAAYAYSGLYTQIIVCDGAHTDTLDLYRRVISSDRWEIPTPASQAWTPLAVRGTLDDSSITGVLDELKESEEDEWTYDIYRFRLFRYVGNQLGQAAENGWLEYGDSVRQHFDVVPGRVFWLKTKESEVITFGAGKTTSLQDTFELTLAPGQWTDFAAPFQFDVSFRAVVEATGAAMDSIQLYHWVKDQQQETYGASEFYISSFESLAASALDNALCGEVGKFAYTAFNPLDEAVVLRIPPVSADEGAFGKEMVRPDGKPSQWGVWFNWREAGQLNSRKIRCVVDDDLNESQRAFALAPSLQKMGAGVVDTLNRTLAGHMITRDDNQRGYIWQVVMYNQGDESKEISYNLQNVSSIPPHLEVRLWDPETQSLETVSDGWHSEILRPASEKNKWIVVGTSQYLSDFKTNFPGANLALSGCFPNPFAGRLSIRYRVPSNNLKQIDFGIYDLRGRLIWNTAVTHPLPGNRLLVWDGFSDERSKVAAGRYILRMTAKAPDGTRKIIGEQGITYLSK